MHSACKTPPSPITPPRRHPDLPHAVFRSSQTSLSLPPCIQHTAPLLLCCGQCTASPPRPPPQKDPPWSPTPHSPQGPCCVGRIAHSTRHVCCSFTLCWRCEAGLCDALTPVIVSPKCKAVAPSCGQVFSWEFYSGTVPRLIPSGTHH